MNLGLGEEDNTGHSSKRHDNSSVSSCSAGDCCHQACLQVRRGHGPSNGLVFLTPASPSFEVKLLYDFQQVS